MIKARGKKNPNKNKTKSPADFLRSFLCPSGGLGKQHNHQINQISEIKEDPDLRRLSPVNNLFLFKMRTSSH